MSTVIERENVGQDGECPLKIRHIYPHPYDRTFCGRPRTTPMGELTMSPKAGAEYCVVCWSMWKNGALDAP